MNGFHPITARWFAETLGEPTAAQLRGWQAIREGRHTLIAAPTGSGKTLAAFLTALDDLLREGLTAPLPDEVRVVYVSPLKALSADIHKNLGEPRRGIRELAEAQAAGDGADVAGVAGANIPKITAAVRTGDTPAAERAAMIKTPPHILVTTPESLYLLLTAERSRAMLRTARTVIVDEIHAVIGTRRGAHLALTLERLQEVAERPLQRIGLSATQKPIEDVAQFLTGTRDGECIVIDTGHRRAMDLALEIPRSPLDAVMSHEVWSEYYDRLTELIHQHRTTLIFVNTRRMAERVAHQLSERLGDPATGSGQLLVTAHHGSLSKDKRLAAEGRLKAGELKALVATASLELGIDIGSVDLVCQIGSPHRIATFLQRVGRSGHTIAGLPKGRIFPESRNDLVECAALLRAVGRGDLDRIVHHDAPLDVLAQQIVAEAASREYQDEALFELCRRARPYRNLSREQFESVLTMVSEGYTTRRGRRGALLHRDEVNHVVRGRRGSRSLAITAGGAIPEVADYRVLLNPEDTFIGTLNEDFAIESTAGDIFQLGNASWQVLQVGAGVVRVADAKGAPPTLPFWVGEAPGRSDELSRAVSDLCADTDAALSEAEGFSPAIQWFAKETGLSEAAADQAVSYLAEGRRALGVLPTQQTLVLERFFDESGGMQLVLHSPFGSRINKAWGLALRKRFCRQFNFELQAAATEDALLLSLGPQHSFPLADVFRYLHPATARDILVQAFLDAPVFQTRWRWNATISLAVPRNRHGKKVAPPLQRMQADDLMAACFPDAAACLENIPGDRQIPDHPLVSQTIRDCLEEAMDFDGLSAILERIHRGEIRCVAVDTTEPSTLSHAILNAKPYAFLDDAPLEERRTQAVMTRRAGDPGQHGALDAAAIARVRDEERPAPRDADELHDAIVTAGFLTRDEVALLDPSWLDELIRTRRATRAVIQSPASSPESPASSHLVIAAERLPVFRAIDPSIVIDPVIEAPASRAARGSAVMSRGDAIVEILRGRLAITGPTTAMELATTCALPVADVETALLAIEADGAALRGRFEDRTGGQIGGQIPDRIADEVQWCDRRLLARIHRYTLNRLRAEIEPVSPADFMRFLFAWQHVAPAHRLVGGDGLREVVEQLNGFESPAASWERAILPARVEPYDGPMLDNLCLTGEVGWARTSPPAPDVSGIVGATPIALFPREHAALWTSVPDTAALDTASRAVADVLRERGASFAYELASACRLDDEALKSALARLVAAGVITSDGFGGLRSLLRASVGRPAANGRPHVAGRWALVPGTVPGSVPGTVPGLVPGTVPGTESVETQARVLLRRYGVICRRLLTREPAAAPWRALVHVYRILEARGEIRGGRFVAGLSGEQFALPDAVDRLREIRRTPADGRLIAISAADPLNLAGIVTAGERVRAQTTTQIAYCDGVPVAVLEGDFVRPLTEVPPAIASHVATALAGRPVPPVVSGYVGRN